MMRQDIKNLQAIVHAASSLDHMTEHDLFALDRDPVVVFEARRPFSGCAIVQPVKQRATSVTSLWV